MDGKKKSSRPPPINARAETIETSGMFRNAVKPERCIIPADGFFEWKGIQGEKTKQPMHIRLKDHTTFGFAGLYTKLTKDKLSGTAVILTTTPDELLVPIHDRIHRRGRWGR
jgi:putative SOS response-associated peptidase YedK